MTALLESTYFVDKSFRYLGNLLTHIDTTLRYSYLYLITDKASLLAGGDGRR